MIYNEDCLIGMNKIPDATVDLVLTDLPYGFLYYEKGGLELQTLWSHFKRVLKPLGTAVLFSSRRFSIDLAYSNREQFKYKWVWIKNTISNFPNAKNCPLSAYEGGQPRIYRRAQRRSAELGVNQND